MSAVSNNRPLYVTTEWPGGNGLIESRATFQPGQTITIDGSATISIPVMTDSVNIGSPVRWEAQLANGKATPKALEALPDAAIDPKQFNGQKVDGPTSQMRIDAQAFTLPWMPGDSHLTMIAKNVHGKILAKEEFDVRGAMALHA